MARKLVTPLQARRGFGFIDIQPDGSVRLNPDVGILDFNAGFGIGAPITNPAGLGSVLIDSAGVVGIESVTDANNQQQISLPGNPQLRIATPTGPFWRIGRHSATDGSGNTDNVIALAYNAQWNQGTPTGGYWAEVDSSTQPQYSMSFESYWNGQAEWNWDLQAAGVAPGAFNRPFGAYCNYTTWQGGFSFGGPGGAAGWGGVTGSFGAPVGQLIAISSNGQTGANPLFYMQRNNGTAFLKVHPTTASLVVTGSGTADVTSSGYNGIVNVLDGSTPVLSLGTIDANQTVLQMLVANTGGTTDAYPRFTISTAGIASWGTGAAATDTSLQRSAVNTLAMSGDLLGPAGATTMVQGFLYVPAAAGAPSGTPTNASATRAALYYDSTDGRLYFNFNGAWHYVTQTA